MNSRRAFSLILGFVSGSLALAQDKKAPDLVCDKVLEAFQDADEFGMPKGWASHNDSGMDRARKKKVYQIVKEGNETFLKAHAENEAITLHKKLQGAWNLSDYPYLRWRWRAQKLPSGAREDQSSVNDVAAGLYVIWESTFLMRVKSIKFTWSTSLPVQTHLSKRLGFDQILVLRSGSQQLGQWQEETINVLDLAKLYYKQNSPKNPIALGILTDSDSTKSDAAGDYGEIRVCRPKN